MNKFICIVLLAFVCQIASAQDSLVDEISFPDNSTEVAHLTEGTKAFGEFCTNQRGFVVDDLHYGGYGNGIIVFQMLFDSARHVESKNIELEKEMIAKFSQQLNNPAESSSEVESIIAKAQELSQAEQGQASGVIKAIASTLAATKTGIANNVGVGISNIQTSVSAESALMRLNEACSSFKKYDTIMREDFEKTKSKLAESDASVATLQLEDVKCVTVGRVLGLEAVCDLVKAIQGRLSH